MTLRRRAATLGVTAVVVASAATVVAAPGANAATPVQSYSLPPAGTFQVVWHGNGHGHGLSQYGAQGAALKGLTYSQILSFYYPGTSPGKTSVTTLRVGLSGGYAKTCIYVPTDNSVTIAGRTISKAGYVRIARNGDGFDLKKVSKSTAHPCSAAGSTFLSVKASRVDATGTTGYVRLMRTDGTSRDYYGTISAVASGSSSQITVNTVNIDKYVQGVVPRESPASWQPAALQAQAVAARTYAVYVRNAASAYDICDTSSCQVYGGRQWYDSNGKPTTIHDDPAAVSGNQGEVRLYHGAVAFTQYSASNGGRTAAYSSYPYLPAQVDPYDSAASGDPYLTKSKTVSSAALASYFGFKTVTALDITARDGGSTGYVTLAVLYGTNSAGAVVSKSVTGSQLQSAFGITSSYFTVSASGLPQNVIDYVNKLYQVLLGRAPTASLLQKRGTALQKGTAASTIADTLATSTDARERQVVQAYQSILGRKPSAALLKKRSAAVKKGQYMNVEAVLFGSTDFYKRAGGTRTKFVQSVYKNSLVLQRSASSATVTKWVKKLLAGTSRTQVAKAILISTVQQRKQALVAGEAVLGTHLTTSGEQSWMKTYVKGNYSLETLLATKLVAPAVRKKYGIKR